MSDTIESAENQKEDFRFSWNFVPLSQNDLNSSGFPLGVVYEPLLNKYPISTDYSSSAFPQNVIPVNNKIELLVPGEMKQHKNVYFFVIDICCPEKQHSDLKIFLMKAIAALPEGSHVGLMTYGSFVTVYQLSDDEITKTIVLSGNKKYTQQRLLEMLSINAQDNKRIIMEINEAENVLNSILDNLEIDIINPTKGNRPERCTGAAVGDAIAILESCCPYSNAQILLFTGGPTTKGPGKIVELSRIENVRQFEAIQKGNDSLSREAKKYYTDLSFEANQKGITVNFIGASYEDAGFYEMEPIISATGGFHVLAGSWSDEDLTNTLVNFSTKVIPRSGNEATITVETTPSLKLARGLGVGVEIMSAESGYTKQWRVATLRENTAFSFFFEINGVQTENTLGAVRIITKYRNNASGLMRVRIATKIIKFTSNISDQSAGFDQETAVALLGRYSMSKATFSNTKNIIDEIDHTIVNFCKKYAKGGLFQESMMGIPQLVFYLRRLKCFTLRNASPDLSQSICATFNALNPDNVSLMLVPILTEYTLSNAPSQIALSTDALKPESILLLNSYNRIVACSGSIIAQKKILNEHEKEDNEVLKAIIEQSDADAKAAGEGRFPSPQIFICNENSSHARYLFAAISPAPQDYNENKSSTSLNTHGNEFGDFMNRLREITM